MLEGTCQNSVENERVCVCVCMEIERERERMKEWMRLGCQRIEYRGVEIKMWKRQWIDSEFSGDRKAGRKETWKWTRTIVHLLNDGKDIPIASCSLQIKSKHFSIWVS